MMEKSANIPHNDEQERLSEIISLKMALEYLLERSAALQIEMTGVLIGAAIESVIEEVSEQIDFSDALTDMFHRERSPKITRLN